MATRFARARCTSKTPFSRPRPSLHLAFNVPSHLSRSLASSAAAPGHDRNLPPPNSSSNHIAVLGGGVAGLATTLFLKCFLPDARVTLIESGPRFGGWVQSTKLTHGGREIIFEQGPRSLRPSFNAAGVATLLLIRTLALGRDTLPTWKGSPASINRFIYYKDRLLRLPHPNDGLGLVASLFSSPLYQDVTRPLWKELWEPGRSEELTDETIGSFFRRRFSAGLTDNFVSAGIHGIYAGDIDRLSMKTIFPALWDLEARHGSLGKSAIAKTMAMTNRQTIMPEQDFTLLKVLNGVHYAGNEPPTTLFNLMTKTSLYTLRGGLERIIKQAVHYLQSHERFSRGVKLRLQTRVTEMRPSPTTPGSVRVTMAGNKNSEQDFTHVISALPSKALLSALCAKGGVLPSSEAHKFSVPTVTVMVVNLYYEDLKLRSRRGFGYLLPQSLEYEQNPELALGVVFDSEATPALDAGATFGTKLTVMLGGHWWDGWTTYPTEQEGIQMAKSLLRRQLGIDAEPTKAQATLQKDCIPQYEVGHAQKAAELGNKLERVFGRRFEVIGASWCGVSVNDCIKSAFKAAFNASRKVPQFDTMRSVDWSYQPVRSYPVREVENVIYGGTVIRSLDQAAPF